MDIEAVSKQNFDYQNLVVVASKLLQDDHEEMHFVHASWRRLHPRETAMDRTIQIVVALTTGLKVSSILRWDKMPGLVIHQGIFCLHRLLPVYIGVYIG